MFRRWLAGHPTVHAVLVNSGWLLMERIMRLLLALLVGAWVARHLGPENYGALAYVVALILLWQAIAGLGLESIVIRALAHEPAAAGTILGTALGLRLAASVLCWLGVVATISALEAGNQMALLVGLILGGGIVFQVADLVDQWFQSQTQSRHVVAPRTIAAITSAMVKVAMILADAPLWGFALALLADTALAGIALAWVFRRRGTSARWNFQGGRAFHLLRDSWPLMLASCSVAIYMRVDLVILRTLAGEHEAGLYAAVVPLSTALHMVPMTVCASILARLSVLRTTEPQRYARHMQQLFAIMAWAGIGVAASIAATARWVVPLLLGPEFAPAIPVLQWHAITNVFVFLGVAQTVAIVSDQTSRHALYRTVSGACVGITLNWILVPRWGALGAAWAAVAAQFCVAILSNALLAPHYLRMQMKALWPFDAK